MKLKRRHFLRGLGGALVGAPYLSSVAEHAARAQGVPTAGDPKRLIVMFTHYGCLTDRWFPALSHGALGAEDFMGTSLEALAPHAEKLLMPRGIRAMNQWIADGSLGQGNDPHTQVVGTYFTGVPVTPNSDDPFSFEVATKFNAMPTAPSLDHICARQLNTNRLPLFMRVGNKTDNPQSGISYSASEEPYAGIGDLTQAFNNLTGLFDRGEMSEDSFQALRGQSAIDLVREDLERLQGLDMSASDRQKLAAWMALLDDTGRAIVSMQCNETTAAELGLTSANFESVRTATEDVLATKVMGDLDGADLYSNIAVLASLCDLSRVTFLKYPGNYTFRALGLTLDSHGLSHRVGNANMQGGCVSGVNDKLQTIDRYYAEKFAHLVEQLNSFDEGEGTVLDNSATVWFQEMSDGNAHNLNNLPILQAGSCGGYFKIGHAVNVDGGATDLSRGNSVAVCEVSAQPTTGVVASGTPNELANAPINKYLCNLMNAIGVKAGADGFPMEGGTEPVSRWGMYDRTEDFVGGGTVPANISDPGEFADLRTS